LPILLTAGPYLEPPEHPVAARRLMVLLSVTRRGAIRHDPTLLCMLAALVELFDDAFKHVMEVQQRGMAAFIRSLFMVRLSDFTSPCCLLCLQAGPKLEESFSRAVAMTMAVQLDSPIHVSIVLQSLRNITHLHCFF
jgi:hypothetical protein